DMYFYSLNTRGFYSSDIHGENIPVDALEISPERHLELLEALSSGQTIKLDEDGHLVTADATLTEAQQLASMRLLRDSRLDATDWMIVRHRDETDIGRATTLAVDQFTALLAYRQALRDLPEQDGFPYVMAPPPPDFLVPEFDRFR
ncbi:MAG: phage tail assembly chaperone, partial [Achromobacter pestifer]